MFHVNGQRTRVTVTVAAAAGAGDRAGSRAVK
jgi:hypothetical protein